MKAWWVYAEHLGGVYVRADTPGKAKTFYPEYNSGMNWEEFLAIRALRAPWLDGDGPARELDAVYKACDHPEETFDLHWGCPVCFEGSYVDRAATIKANA